jgi:hypothetical protein
MSELLSDWVRSQGRPRVDNPAETAVSAREAWYNDNKQQHIAHARHVSLLLQREPPQTDHNGGQT